jgi:hypothetical protein
MDSLPFHSQVESLEDTPIKDLYPFFTYYHPERPTYEYALSIFDDCEYMEESENLFSSVSKFILPPAFKIFDAGRWSLNRQTFPLV